MIERSIMIFPHFENMDIIYRVRDKYDPLSEHVRPHITLVFPFNSEISKEELSQHIKAAIKETKPFELELCGVIPWIEGGNYLFLKVIQGNAELKKIHDNLYKGVLGKFLREDISYQPHMTIGNLKDSKELEGALNSVEQIEDRFKTTVSKISVEIIDKSLNSIIESEHSLV